MDQGRLEANLEALLFTYGEPLTIEKMAALLETDKEAAKTALADLENNLRRADRGLMIIRNGDGAQLATKSDLNPIAQKIIEMELKEDLTPAAIETLAILAYGGPLNKSEIEYIRGVNSFHILRSLYLRGLIDKEDKRYRPSFNCLRQLGLASLSELPDYQRYQELIKKFKESYGG